MLVKLIHMPDTVQVNDLIQRIDDIGKDNGGEFSVKKKVNTVNGYVPLETPVSSKIVTVTETTSAKVPAISGGTSSDLTQIQLKWSTFATKIKLDKIRVGAILEKAFPSEVLQDVLRIRFRNNDFTEFHAEIIHKEREYLSAAFKEFTGLRLKIECDLKRSIPDEDGSLKEEVQVLSSEGEANLIGGVKSSENKINGQSASELFKQVRELEQKEPLKKLVELFDCELIDVMYKTN
jgi:hypothetical protein